MKNIGRLVLSRKAGHSEDEMLDEKQKTGFPPEIDKNFLKLESFMQLNISNLCHTKCGKRLAGHQKFDSAWHVL